MTDAVHQQDEEDDRSKGSRGHFVLLEKSWTKRFRPLYTEIISQKWMHALKNRSLAMTLTWSLRGVVKDGKF